MVGLKDSFVGITPQQVYLKKGQMRKISISLHAAIDKTRYI